ncbi:GNAT family N-acetyltransferase, partial [Escherichia coli]|uniref:GNAT family N-acetyltransferase n=1 Tax=Escherichia coli TaxID=562 RepID=UPI00215B51D4
ADRALISAIVEDAFAGPDEARLVEQLSGNGDIVLDLVAEFVGALAGHILFSRLRVENGTSFDAVALAPVSVVSGHQGKGVGSALIKAAHQEL